MVYDLFYLRGAWVEDLLERAEKKSRLSAVDSALDF